MIKLFISHSSQDVELARRLIELLRTGLNLSSEDIRCTSVDGYRLPAGAKTDEQLRREVHEAQAFVGIISHDSLDSLYVAFELGARWGADKHLIPLLAPGMTPNALRGPLSSLNALSCGSSAQLHQLVEDLASRLNAKPDRAAAYQHHVDRILELAVDAAPENEPEVKNTQTSKHRAAASNSASDNYSDAYAVIKEECEKQWPDDFAMQRHCQRQQENAVEELKRGNTRGVPDDVFDRIRSKAASEWPRDYQMQLHAQKQQLDAYEELRGDD